MSRRHRRLPPFPTRRSSDLRGESKSVPVMLVSNYADAQAKAVAHGALEGFGKGELGDDTMLERVRAVLGDRKSTRLNSSHANISYAVFCLKKKTHNPHSAL